MILYCVFELLCSQVLTIELTDTFIAYFYIFKREFLDMKYGGCLQEKHDTISDRNPMQSDDICWTLHPSFGRKNGAMPSRQINTKGRTINSARNFTCSQCNYFRIE